MEDEKAARRLKIEADKKKAEEARRIEAEEKAKKDKQKANEAALKAEQERIAAEEAEQGIVGIGIDLGTSNSVVGLWRNGKIEILQNDDNRENFTPSVVAYEGKNVIVGRAAWNRFRSKALHSPTK